jgi:hypothetical protein
MKARSFMAGLATLAAFASPWSARAEAALSQQLYAAALAAPQSAKADGTLFGVQRWRPSTSVTYFGLQFPGLLSCAYTVSAIFVGAGHPIGEIASVKGIDRALASWPKVMDAGALRRGDIVFWKPRERRLLGVRCPSAHWHVGVSAGGDDVIDNDWWSGTPKMSKLGRLCVDFAYARRAPDTEKNNQSKKHV